MKKLLFLHGAIGSSVQLETLAYRFGETYKVYLYNFSGHGGKKIPQQFSIELFAYELNTFINKNKLKHINIFGYSMGGYIALYMSRHYPETINKIFTIGTKFKWNEEISMKESRLLNPEKIIEKVPRFAEELSKRHAPEDWKKVLNKTSEMMINLGKNNSIKDTDFGLIENEVMVCVGDRDNMVTIEETADVYRKLKNGKLMVIPGTPHPIEQISVERLVYEIKNFFQ